MASKFAFPVGGRYGTFKVGQSPIGGMVQLVNEFKKNPEAVINRLIRFGEEELLEDVANKAWGRVNNA